MLNIRKFLSALGIVPTSSTAISAQGEMEVLSSNGKLNYHNGSSASPLVSEAHTATLTNKTLSGNTAATLISGSGTLTLNTSGTVTLPNATDTLVGKATTDTLTNKTLTSPAINTPTITGSGGTLTLPAGPTTLVGRDTTDTLTNKTISGNTAVNLVSGSGTLTLNTTGTVTVPNATDTLVGKATTDTLTNKTLTTPVIASISNSGTITLPTGTDTLVARATTDSLTNKTFSDAVTGAQISTPSNPSSGFDKLYFKNDDKLYTLNSSGVETAIGAGSGGINYIANPDAESATTGWATYFNTAANIPSTGTGGTATGLTFSRSTSSPLRGAASFSLVQANSTSLQGKGVSYDFTINSADQARMLSISFDYNASSTFVASNGTTAPLNDGTTTTNAGNSDLEVFIYDVTNAKLIPVSPQVLTANGTNNYQYVGQFQTASNSTSYRLIFHVATTSANATGWTVKYDNVQVGPQTKLLGPPITDWVTYTPTGSYNTNTTYSGRWRRVGDEMEGQVYITFSGTPNTATLTDVNLPTGYTIDTSKLAAGTNTDADQIGCGEYLGSDGNSYQILTAYRSTTSVRPLIINSGSTFGFVAAITNANPATITSASQIQLTFKVPVSGWSSTTTMSNDTDSRVVAMSATTTTISSGGANTPIVFGTTQFDTHAGYNASTGRYTVPVSGKYRVSTSGLQNNHPGSVYVWKNGAQAILLDVAVTSSDGFAPFSGSGTLNLVAGDIIDVRLSITIAVGDAGSLSIERLSGPATIAASESVNFQASGTTTGGSGSGVIIVFGTTVFDTHSAYSTSTGRYTVPIAGKYRVSAALNASAAGVISIYKNAVSTTYIGKTSSNGDGTPSGLVQCVAGDIIDIRPSANLGAWSSSPNSVLNIERVGN